MDKMLDDAIYNKSNIYINAFNFDLEFNKNIKNKIIKLLETNHVYMITSGVNKYNININHTNFHIKNKLQIGEKYNDMTLKIKNIFLKIGCDHIFVNHMRYFYNGKYLLFSGTNCSNRYMGNCITENGDNFCWYDNALLLYNDTLESLFNNIYNNIHSNTIRNINYKQLNYIITLSNSYQYTYIIKNILNSKKSIYIENQYFISCDNYTNNKIYKALAYRINMAILNNEDFTLKMIINYYNHDESNITQFIFHQLVQFSLYNFRKLINYSDEIFNKYVTVLVPNTNLVVHSKIFCFDNNKMLYTSCNIIDRSFYNNGDIEAGLIIENSTNVISLMNDINNNFLYIKHLFRIYNFKYNMFTHIKIYICIILYNILYIFNNNILYITGIKLSLKLT
jgi:hypothetical protein